MPNVLKAAYKTVKAIDKASEKPFDRLVGVGVFVAKEIWKHPFQTTLAGLAGFTILKTLEEEFKHQPKDVVRDEHNDIGPNAPQPTEIDARSGALEAREALQEQEVQETDGVLEHDR